MKNEELGISCPAFSRQETAIKNITAEVNQAKGAREKAPLAEELRKEADALLTCPDYDDKSLDCKNCRFIANLRSKTAGVIIKVGKLAKKGE